MRNPSAELLSAMTPAERAQRNLLTKRGAEVDETDRERAERRRICHGVFIKDCPECTEFELALLLKFGKGK